MYKRQVGDSTIKNIHEYIKKAESNLEIATNSYLEHFYRQGQKAFNNELYRTAITNFNTVVETSEYYKDTQEMIKSSTNLAQRYLIINLN